MNSPSPHLEKAGRRAAPAPSDRRYGTASGHAPGMTCVVRGHLPVHHAPHAPSALGHGMAPWSASHRRQVKTIGQLVRRDRRGRRCWRVVRCGRWRVARRGRGCRRLQQGKALRPGVAGRRPDGQSPGGPCPILGRVQRRPRQPLPRPAGPEPAGDPGPPRPAGRRDLLPGGAVTCGRKLN